MFRSASVALFAVVALGFASNATAAPVYSFQVTFGSTSVVTPQQVVFSGGILPSYIQNNGDPSTFISPPHVVSTWNINVAGFNTNPGPVVITSTAPNQFTVTGTGADAGKIATFTLSNTQANNLGSNVVSFSGQATLTSITSPFTTIDFGPIGTIYDFLGSSQPLTFTPGSPGTVSGGAGSASFTFTYSRDNQPGPGDPVPEPATLAVLGLMGAFGGWAVRRKLKTAA
ncbi:MAG: PEP-CTERM sorting domain-containing protein [Gemmataceae bacterium]|nr:PEP-CTERM sorting domain-containing protein [Gemmata sp.]MDW8199174.1 PEP-CTERM sorting domain-containing protein [Gemmataceae bacterium]